MRLRLGMAKPALPLIPLLRAEETVPDADVLATWHAALSNAVGVELPHTLLALWLYPDGGGVALLAPEELAQDNLPVPVPDPVLTGEQTAAVAAIVLRAYPSVLCLPVRLGHRDVGLLLLADLTPDRYGEAERVLAGRVAEALAPSLALLARRWSPGPEGQTDVASAVTAAWTEARSPRDLFARVSGAMRPRLPHDLLEVLIPGPAPGQQYRLAGHPGPPPWGDPALVVGRDRLDLVALFEGEPVFRALDVTTRPDWPADLFAEELPAGQAIRSVLGTRVMSSGHLAAHLLVMSTTPDLYQAADAALLEEAGRLLAPKIEAYVLGSQLYIVRKQLGTLRSAPAHLTRIADMLATTPKLADATRRLAEEVRAMLPCDRITLAVRMVEGDRVVMLEPGETRHLADLPLVPVAGTTVGQVLRSELADALMESGSHAELIVPLRVAGRIVGAIVLTGRGYGAIGRSDIAQVQQLADILAPHVELARRTATMPAPVAPGWKRTSR
ncbi:MAG TPA: GAF domain-containing protein [Gemmatimonadales bacterium]|nr:GAF domain-containing protein [Gemmatimonadales bacterium]